MAKGKKNKQEASGGGGGGWESSRGSKKGGLGQAGPIVGAVLAVAAALYFLTGSGHIKALDAANAAQMKEVIYGGQPWAVLCYDGGKPSSAASAYPMFAKVSWHSLTQS
jgi:hypothetical protein